MGGFVAPFMEKDADKLLKNYRQGQCTPEEKRLIDRFLNKQVSESDLLPDERRMLDSLIRLDAAFKRRVRRRSFYRVAVAASLLLFLTAAAAALYVWFPNRFGPTGAEGVSQLTSTGQGEIAPGGNRAFLTLNDGRRIALRADQEGIVIGDGSVTYMDGTGVELMSGAESAAALEYATLTTPRGGTYQVQLSDGSRVTLNAASTLRYPVQFASSQDREVALEGEAFFEVKPASGSTSAPQAFLVKTAQQVVDVLGTTFNITAYPEDSVVRTTLAEGSVRVTSIQSGGEAPIDLRPGEQSVLDGRQLTKQTVDLSVALAWTQGDIVFDETDLPTIFRQLERWYAVQFEWGDRALDGRLYGKLSRNTHLEEILRVIEQNTDLRFTIHQSPSGERRVVVH